MALLLVGGWGGGLAEAKEADPEAGARAHFEIARGMFRLGDYRGAVREFSAGYKLVPKPEFLLNLGQAYRRLGDTLRARDMYRRYLDEVPEDEPMRADVQAILGDLESAPLVSPPDPEVEARPAPAAQPASPLPTVELKTPPPSRRKLWWLAAVPVVAVVAATVVGVYFATLRQEIDCAPYSLGCVDSRTR